MGIKVYPDKSGGGARVTPGRRLWLTVDGKLVEDGDPRAYRLYAHPHHRVPKAEYEKLLEESGMGRPAPKLDEKTVAQVKEMVDAAESADDLDQIEADESSGKDRVGVHKAIEARRSEIE